MPVYADKKRPDRYFIKGTYKRKSYFARRDHHGHPFIDRVSAEAYEQTIIKRIDQIRLTQTTQKEIPTFKTLFYRWYEH